MKVIKENHKDKSWIFETECKGNGRKKVPTSVCGSILEVNENDLRCFSKKDIQLSINGKVESTNYYFEVICPICGSRTLIPATEISKEIKQRLISRKQRDDYLEIGFSC